MAHSLSTDARDRYVSMSNRLTRAAQSLNLSEKRVIALCLANTDSVPLKALALGANAGWKVTVSAKSYAEVFGLAPHTAYEQVKDASQKLFERYVSYEVKSKGKSAKPTVKRFRWVSGATYADGEGYVELNFTPEVAPHLLGLRQQFTTYQLRQAAAFDSVYAWRLFELLKSWSSSGLYVAQIDEFMDAMEAPPSCRKDFNNLRVRVIEPAVQSIRDKASLLVEWIPKRLGGRRVTSLEFRFSPDLQGRLALDPLPTEMVHNLA